jgi:hypothetical protein
MAHRFNPVAEGVDQKSGEIVWMIVRAQTRRAIILAAVGQTGGMKRRDLASADGLEAPMAFGIAVGVR